MKITFCIPSKNNLRYLKQSVNSIRENSIYQNSIIVFIDSDNDGTEEWCISNNVDYIKNDSGTPRGIAFGYNRCIEAATTDIVCMFHADMYMAKGFDTGILEYLKPKMVVGATRVEPPLHPEGMEKIVKQFGLYPEDFRREEFDRYVGELLITNQHKTTRSIFAPWAVYKDDIISVGLHDELFHSYHEDSDMFNRFILNGYHIVQSWSAYVYHLTCRGGQFQDGIESITKDASFHHMKYTSGKHYLRKWGSWIKNDQYHYPVISHKYNIAFVLKKATLPLVELLEPWCDRLYIDDDMGVIQSHYVEKEQPNTKYDLTKRVLNLDQNYPEGENDIVVVFDGTKFTNDSFNIIQNLSDIITESGEVGTFELDCFEIIINNMTTYEKSLIKCSTTY